MLMSIEVTLHSIAEGEDWKQSRRSGVEEVERWALVTKSHGVCIHADTFSLVYSAEDKDRSSD